MLELASPDFGDKSAAEIQALTNLLQQEAISFIQANTNDIFQLGKDYVQAILFKSLYSYVEIPPLTDPNDLKQIVAREKALTARDTIFQLVAKAELENVLAVDAITESAEQFGLEMLKKAGEVGVGILVNMLLVALI